MELYYFPASGPCRAVLLFLHALSLKPTLKLIDVTKGEQLSPEYLKLNPQHTIPVIVDNGYVLSESRAILGYIAEQYAQNSSYYPNDPKARGIVNQRLFFDVGTLYQRFLDAYMSPMTEGGSLDEKKVKKLEEAFNYLEAFMGDSPWIAGDEITIADFSFVSTVTSIEACGYDISKHSKVHVWLQKCKKEMKDYEEANQKGVDILGHIVKETLKI